nr:hypothetical protein [uncultured Thiodictyon sp.]
MLDPHQGRGRLLPGALPRGGVQAVEEHAGEDAAGRDEQFARGRGGGGALTTRMSMARLARAPGTAGLGPLAVGGLNI